MNSNHTIVSSIIGTIDSIIGITMISSHTITNGSVTNPSSTTPTSVGVHLLV